MKSFQQLAKVAHEALGAQIAKANSTTPRPWEELSPEEQATWVVVMQAVVAELESIH